MKGERRSWKEEKKFLQKETDFSPDGTRPSFSKCKPRPFRGVVVDKADATKELKDEYDRICRVWTGNAAEIESSNMNNSGNGDNQKLIISENAKTAVNNLISRMNIPQNAYVGLNLTLLQGDIERTLEQKQPIISMQLYLLLSKKHECFLYSKYFMADEFIKTWKEVYAKYYETEEIPYIYKRNQLSQVNIS